MPAQPPAAQTVLPLIEVSAGFLAAQGIDEARLTAELLLAHVLRCRRIDLYLRFEQVVTADELAAYRECIRRRLKREPVQYITGYTEFMGLRFTVDSRVLIPRPETELLVERVIDYVKSGAMPDPAILDIGTGSGNIAVSCARMIPGCRVDAVDASGGAIEIASENAGNNQCADRVTLRKLDFLKEAGSLHGQYAFVLSNPPYIPVDESPSLQPEVRDYEPKTAWTDGNDGLTFYRAIARESGRLVAENGRVIVEIGYGQAKDVAELFRAAGFGEIEIRKDYGGIERILTAGR
jgi:release factor glutamine methyltransferase